MGRTTGVATHVASVVLVVLAAGPAAAAPLDHDHPAPTPTAQADPHSGHGGTARSPAPADHAGRAVPATPTTAGDVTDQTRLVVLGGFGAINAAVVLGALALRRTGHGRTPRAAR